MLDRTSEGNLTAGLMDWGRLGNRSDVTAEAGRAQGQNAATGWPRPSARTDMLLPSARGEEINDRMLQIPGCAVCPQVRPEAPVGVRWCLGSIKDIGLSLHSSLLLLLFFLSIFLIYIFIYSLMI